MKKTLILLAFLFWIIPRETGAATGCAYPTTLDTFVNVSTGTILTAADYNKLLCAVENLEANFRLRNYTATTLPASPTIGQLIYVTDALNNTTCTTGGGSTRNVCVYNGVGWAVAGGGGGAASIDLTGTYPWTGAHSFLDTNFSILDSAAPTKTLRFDAANITAGTTVTLATPGVNTTLIGLNTFAALSTGVVKVTTGTGALSGGTVAIAEGGTGATTQAGAQTALALVPGTNVFTQRTFQDQTNVLTWINGNGVAGNPTPSVANAIIDGSSHFAADSGSSDDYAACPRSISTMSTPAYVDQSIHGFRANTVNTGASTINYCGLGSRALVKLIGGVAVPTATGDILVGQPVLTTFHASLNSFQIISPLASGGGGTGVPGGSNTQCQFNDAGVFGGDAGCTYDKTTDVLATTGGYAAGNVATNSVNSVVGGGVSGAKTYTWARNANMDYAGTTGSLTLGNSAKFDADGLVVDGGPRYKTCVIENDMQSATPLANANITGRCPFDVAGTLTEIVVFASSGTPSALLERWRPNGGAVADLTSSALATAATGAYACSKTGATAGIAGITCSATLQNTTINAGDVIRVKSATAGGTATWLMIKATVIY